MKKNTLFALLGLFLVSVLTLTSCSKDEDEFENATHVAYVTPVPMGILRLDNIKLFVSDAPFQSWDNFKPLSSVELPKNRTAIDPVRVNVSNYVGKTVYITALRKYLLSDKYYSVMSAPTTSTKLTVAAEETEPELSFVIGEPANNSYTKDQGTARLTVKKGGNVVSGKTVYYFRNNLGAWSNEMKRTYEERFLVDGDRSFSKAGTTKADGTLEFKRDIDEVGKSGDVDLNEYALFIMEGGKVKDVIVKFNALNVTATLQY